MMKAVVKELKAEQKRLSKELKVVEGLLGRAGGSAVRRKRRVSKPAKDVAPTQKVVGRKAKGVAQTAELEQKRARLKALRSEAAE